MYLLTDVNNINIDSEMTLINDVYTDNNILIAKKNSVLDKRILGKLKLYGIESVALKKNNELPQKTLDENTILTKQKISKKFSEVLKQTETNFNDIVKGKKVNTNSINKTSDELLSVIKKDSDIFNYLYNMNEENAIHKHCINVGVMSKVFAKHLNFSDNESELLGITGFLHDIGKLKLKETILNKTDKISPREFSYIQKHVVHSYNLINDQDIDDKVKIAVLRHHEKLDGSGYFHLNSEDIPTFPRIISIVDIYDALTQDKPYRKKYVPLDALHIMKNEFITKLDYIYLQKFISFVSKTFQDSYCKFNTGEEGTIVYINDNHINKPIVKIDGCVIDLNNETNLEVVEIY